MLRLSAALPALIFAAVAAGLGFSLRNDPHKMPSTLIDKALPTFTLPPLDGRSEGFASNDVKGRVSLINVFASWCPQCQVEHPTLLGLAAAGKVPLYGVNWKDKPGDGQRWLTAHRSPYLKAGDDRNGRLGIDLGVTGVPETFVVDREGRVRYRHAGPITPDVWQETFVPLILALGASP